MGAVEYLTLPSNSSYKFYPNNTKSHFTTKLHTPLSFKDLNYEVALTDIYYPHTWNNIDEDEGRMVITRLGTDFSFTSTIKNGHYNSATDLIDAINGVNDLTRVGPDSTPITLKWDHVTQKVHMSVARGFSIKFSKALVQILGLKRDTYEGGTYRGKYVVDIERGFYVIHVYCNIIRARIVGDTCVPLLKTVPVQGKHGDFIHISFNNPHFHPIHHSEIGDIEIDIRDDLGKNIPFNSGKVVCVLAYRRKPLSI